MSVEVRIYGPDPLISAHTNRPLITIAQPAKGIPIFWCERCSQKLTTPIQAIQHLAGRTHKTKLHSSNDVHIQDNLNELNRKRGFEDPEVNIKTTPPEQYDILQPNTKRNKVESVNPVLSELTSDQSLICNECSLVFTSHMTAEQHLKGKKHLAVIAVKLSSSKNPTPADKTHFCQACNIALNSEGQIKQHYNGVRHKLNAGTVIDAPGWWVEQQTTFDQTNTKRSSGKGVGETFRCDICAIELNSESQYGQHITSSKHKQREQSGTREAGTRGTNQRGVSRSNTLRGGRGHEYGSRSQEHRGRGQIYGGRSRLRGDHYWRGWGLIRGVSCMGGYSTFRGRSAPRRLRRGWVSGKQRGQFNRGLGISDHRYDIPPFNVPNHNYPPVAW